MPPIISSLLARLFGGPASAVFRGMGTLALGTGAARVIGVVSIPVLTRIYSPEDYGVLSIFTALVAMLVPVLTLRYGVAVPLPRQDGMAMNLMALAASLMLGIALAVTLILAIFGPALLGLASMEVLAPYWWLIALGMIGAASYELLSLWATRRRAYRIVAQTQVTQSVFGAVVKIGLGLLALKPMGLLIGQVVAQSSGIGSFIKRFWEDFRRTVGMISLRRMGFVARYYRGFPIYRLPSQFLLVFSTKAPLLFVAALYDVETTGQLGLALMALALPMNLLGGTIGKPYYAEVAKLGKKAAPEVRTLTVMIIKRLFLISLIPAVVLFFAGPVLFRMVFGENWVLAGEIASVLSIYLVAQFVSSPIVQVLNIFGRQSVYLQLNIQRTLLLIVVFGVAAYWQFPILATILAYSLIMTLHYLFTLFRVVSCIRA